MGSMFWVEQKARWAEAKTNLCGHILAAVERAALACSSVCGFMPRQCSQRTERCEFHSQLEEIYCPSGGARAAHWARRSRHVRACRVVSCHAGRLDRKQSMRAGASGSSERARLRTVFHSFSNCSKFLLLLLPAVGPTFDRKQGENRSNHADA